MCSIAVMQSLLSFLIQSAHIKLNQQDYFCVKNNSLRTQERKFILLFFFPPPPRLVHTGVLHVAFCASCPLILDEKC